MTKAERAAKKERIREARAAYVREQYAKLDKFVDDVENEGFPVNQWIKKAVERYRRDLSDPRYEFREKELDKVFAFIFYVRINQGDKYRRFYPEGWQLFYFANLYGIYRKKNGRRKYTTSFLSIARKNGKTTFAAVQALVHLVKGGVIDSQIYFVSGSKDMAGNGLEYAKNIVEHSPALAKRVRVLQYSLRHKTKETNNFFKTLPAEPDKLNSIRPAFGVIDETHIMPDDSLVKMMKSGQVGIKNPMMGITTTRGFNLDYFQYEYEQYLRKVLDQEAEDEGTFIMMFGLDDEEEVGNPDMWVKANPNLLNPDALTIEELQDIYDQERRTLTGLRSFVTLNLNTWWEKGDGSFIPRDVLDKVFVQEIPDEIIEGEECYMGIDLSSTKDITSISLVFPPSINHSEYIIKNWNFKTNAVEKRVRKNGVDLTQHIETGDLIEIDRPIVDYNVLFDKVAELNERYNIRAVGHDGFNSALLMPKIKEELGLECRHIIQSAPKLNFPTKFLEKLIYDENVVIDNQVNKWMFGNVKLFVDGNYNVKPMKNKSLDSIDGVVSELNAMACYIEDIGEEQLNYVATAV
jgi:phage terminase large subunit-like protein